MKPYRLISLLLQYPEREIVAARAELAEAVDRLPSRATRASCRRFLSSWESRPLTELQQDYVATFDFDRRASLHLTFHTHGDRRQRGIELVRLKRRYAEAGLPLEGELPDYLPVLLEFADLAPDGAGEGLLAELREPIELVRSALSEKGSPHAHLLDALCAELPALTQRQAERVRRLAEAGPPSELVGLEPFPPAEPERIEAAGGDAW